MKSFSGAMGWPPGWAMADAETKRARLMEIWAFMMILVGLRAAQGTLV
jgi:hypothetical protein